MTTVKASKMKLNKRTKGKSWVFFQKKVKKTAPSDASGTPKAEGQSENAVLEQARKRETKLLKKKLKRKQRKLERKKQRNVAAKLETEVKSEQKTDATQKDLPEASERKPDKKGLKNLEKLTDQSVHNSVGESAKKSKDIQSIVGSDDSRSSMKAKQLRKKEKRKLKILKRKEKEKLSRKENSDGSSTHAKSGSGSGNSEGIHEGTNQNSKVVKKAGVAGQGKSNEASHVAGNEGSQKTNQKEKSEESINKELTRKRKRKRKASKEKKKKEGGDVKRRRVDQDSGMSSGTETPPLVKEPQDVAANWKALIDTIKASAPAKRRPGNQKKQPSENQESKEENKEIWFDDVDAALLEAENVLSSKKQGGGVPMDSSDVGSHRITRCVGLDCEMVGIGHEGKDSILARVSMVNEYGQCIYDKFVKPREKVTDYRTEFSGVRPLNLAKAEEFLTVQKEVADIMKGRVLVGHALRNDMKVLFLGHPRKMTRDTATYKHFREIMKTNRPGLKKLAKTMLGVTVQDGEHSSVEDAQAAMKLYTLHRVAWEKALKQKGKVAKKGA